MKILITSLAIFACSTSVAMAQNFYGAGDLSFGQFTVNDTGADEGTGNLLSFGGYVGTEFGSGLFVEGEFQTSQTSALSNPGANNGLRNGYVYALRVGKDFGDFTLDGFVGQFSAISGDNDAPGDEPIQRYFLGLTGSYAVSEQFQLSGLIGYLDGDTSISGSNGDSFSNFSHVSVGADYDISNSLTVSAAVTYGWGDMDGSPNTARGLDLEVGVSYTFANPNMQAYASYLHTRLDQTDDGDYSIEDHLQIGFVWTFGNSGAVRTSERVALPDYLGWSTGFDGHLE